MNKKILSIICASSILALGAAVFGTKYISKDAFQFKAAGCNHVGYHYAAKDATDDEHGWKEFWVCCKCHESFLEQPTGTFTDQDSSKMVGGMDENHIAYISPLKGGGNGDYYIVDPFDED